MSDDSFETLKSNLKDWLEAEGFVITSSWKDTQLSDPMISELEIGIPLKPTADQFPHLAKFINQDYASSHWPLSEKIKLEQPYDIPLRCGICHKNGKFEIGFRREIEYQYDKYVEIQQAIRNFARRFSSKYFAEREQHLKTLENYKKCVHQDEVDELVSKIMTRVRAAGDNYHDHMSIVCDQAVSQFRQSPIWKKRPPDDQSVISSLYQLESRLSRLCSI